MSALKLLGSHDDLLVEAITDEELLPSLCGASLTVNASLLTQYAGNTEALMKSDVFQVYSWWKWQVVPY